MEIFELPLGVKLRTLVSPVIFPECLFCQISKGFSSRNFWGLCLHFERQTIILKFLSRCLLKCNYIEHFTTFRVVSLYNCAPKPPFQQGCGVVRLKAVPILETRKLGQLSQMLQITMTAPEQVPESSLLILVFFLSHKNCPYLRKYSITMNKIWQVYKEWIFILNFSYLWKLCLSFPKVFW